MMDSKRKRYIALEFISRLGDASMSAARFKPVLEEFLASPPDYRFDVADGLLTFSGNEAEPLGSRSIAMAFFAMIAGVCGLKGQRETIDRITDVVDQTLVLRSRQTPASKVWTQDQVTLLINGILALLAVDRSVALAKIEKLLEEGPRSSFSKKLEELRARFRTDET